MKDTIKYIVDIIDIPAFVINKKQEIVASNQYFLVILQNTDISKNKELKNRIDSFVQKPERFLDTVFGQQTIKALKTITNNPKIFSLVSLLENIGYKITHLSSISIPLNFQNQILSNVLIFRIFSSKLSKVNELYMVLFDVNIIDILGNSVDRETEDVNKKYMVLLQVANKVFSTVKGFTETLILGKYRDYDLIYRFIEIIDNQVSNGIKILLSFNLSNNLGNFVFQKTNLYNFLTDLITKYSQKILNEYPDIAFEYYVQPNIPDLYTDPSKLELCVYNLLDNAIRFRDESKEEKRVKFKAFFESSINAILITIEDNGIGMSKKELSQIGQIFKTFSEKSGIGLGMYIVYKIVRSMNWNIKIESKKNEYTKVTLIIPFENT
ncbi:MAG: ATP-binding protein [Candidatus Calescibacterium sp.]|nr:ATP-binding protein [Candidatus Calescibacterium sp.]MCX7971891.1 ATP-binding protein [bacterium]MDW8195010.1 ATP-binding protein [Candidatus Calescibacterium sp.]